MSRRRKAAQNTGPRVRHPESPRAAATPPSDAAGNPIGGRVVRGEWEALVQLFGRATPLSMSHWNPHSGELFELPRGKQREATALRFEERLWREPQWVEIPCQESDSGYQQAQDFVTSLRPGRGRQELTAALEGAKPFRALRAVLDRHPGLKRRWQAIAEAEATLRLVEFCISQQWRLDDRRFDEAVERWLDATEDMTAVDDHAGPPAAAATYRTAGTLSIGRIRDGDEPAP